MHSKKESPALTIKEQTNSGIDVSYTMQTGNLHIELRNGEPIFLAKDVCDILGIVNSRDALSSLDEDEKLVSVVATSGQRREMNFVTESGLYSLIFQSRKPEAKKFRKWVTAEVLPSIRKKGFYGKTPQVLLNGSNPFETILSYCRKIEHEDKVWYAATQLRVLMGKQPRGGSVTKMLNRLEEQGFAKHLLESNNVKKWYVTKQGIANLLNIKPNNLVNISMLELLNKGDIA